MHQKPLRTQVLTTLALTALLLAQTKAIIPLPGGQKLGDLQPFCLFPEVWESSLKPVSQVIDPIRYRGLWYELARLPNSFQEECVCSNAEYSLQPLRIGVYNTCYGVSGRIVDDASGFAIPTNAQSSKLKVYFNIFGGNYWILDIGDSYDYGYVMVGEPCRDFLWILSRTKELPEGKMVELLKKARRLGFETDNMVARSPAAYC